MKNKIISALYQREIFSRINIHFAQFISHFPSANDPDIFLAAALVSRATENGDICLDLNDNAETIILKQENGHDALICPKINRWVETLSVSPATGKPGEKRPLILDSQNRLYLFRYWEYEKILTDLILKRVHDHITDLDFPRLRRSLGTHFPKDSGEPIDWQKIAAVTAMLKKFSVITGGPGTGKTFMITKILVLLLEQVSGGALKICLAAPTGKAAARLQESIRRTKQSLNCDDKLKEAIPTEVKTIHRMLKPKPASPYFHYNAENPLSADIVVIDEASMVDLALMSKLVQAVPKNARLVLVGDKDQLASVEAGSVLGDICDRNNLHGVSDDLRRKILELTDDDMNAIVKGSRPEPGLQDCIVVLQKSHRFAVGSGIGRLSRAVNRGEADEALMVLEDAPDKTIALYEMGPAEEFFDTMAKKIIDGYRAYLESEDPAAALESFNRFKIVCALRMGPFGVRSLNKLAEQVLEQQGLIHLDTVHTNPWYKGRPILITRNDYNLGLFNGDIGITLPNPDAKTRELSVFFSAGDGEIKRFAIHRLPEHETVFAMTVHKSQGSEFDEVVLILPNKDYPVLTRELVYTGLTRSKNKFSVWATRSILRNTIKRKIERTSGLREALWK
ncbi:MAG: exodeoxyribonuclease V subunit alpha [Desulfobacterales bacterium]|nr:MAG: exodeoxyribonuclease V subunit alpha [Desulfobacterales bacterium]